MRIPIANKFSINIELGNDEMQSPRDIAAALKRIAQDLEENAIGVDGQILSQGDKVFDTNGNKVGQWKAYRSKDK